MVSALLLSFLSVAPPQPSVVPFIEDDYRRAVAEARRRKLPLFVDAWAPWCHSCLSMRAYVFPDSALDAVKDRFVWLSVNTERKANAPFLDRFPIDAWPTLLVLDASDQRERARWLGSMGAPELVERLQTLIAERGEDELLREAQAEEAAGRRAEAVEICHRALKVRTTPEKRGAVVQTLLEMLQAQHPRECSDLAASEAALLPPGSLRASIAATGLTCALSISPVDKSALQRAETQVHQVVDHPGAYLATDDVSSLFELLVQARKAASDPEGARQTGLAWMVVLEAATHSASSPTERSVFDAHRVLAYEAAGLPERAIPMLEQSERDFPDDYNPPARLASVLLRVNRPAEALSAAQRAEARIYGPRTLRLLLTEAEALRKMGRREDARHKLRDAESFVARLPAGQRRPSHWKQLDEARRELAR